MRHHRPVSLSLFSRYLDLATEHGVRPAKATKLLKSCVRRRKSVSTQSFSSAQNQSFSRANRQGAKRIDRIQSSAYRDLLKDHGVYPDPYGRSIPDNVRTFARHLIYKDRNSPPLNDDEVMAMQDRRVELVNADDHHNLRRASLAH